MSIRSALRGIFRMTEPNYPTFAYSGAKFHFRLQTGGDESWAVSYASTITASMEERQMLHNRLVTLVCVTKVETVENGVKKFTPPFVEFLERDKIANKQFAEVLDKALAEYEKNPDSPPPPEVQRRAAIEMLRFMNEMPSGAINALVLFFMTEITPLAVARHVTQYVCPVCVDTVPGYEMPVKPTWPNGSTPFCEHCGGKTEIHDTLRVEADQVRNPLD